MENPSLGRGDQCTIVGEKKRRPQDDCLRETGIESGCGKEREEGKEKTEKKQEEEEEEEEEDDDEEDVKL